MLFRTEQGVPTQYAGGFPDFMDHTVEELLAGCRPEDSPTLLHVIAPALSPDDAWAFEERNGSMPPSTVVGPQYKERIARVGRLGCATTRLQVLAGVADSEEFVAWLGDICRPAHAVTGEGCQAALWSDLVGPMAAALPDEAGRALRQDLTDGLRRDVPTGGFWAFYRDRGMNDMRCAAGVMYTRGAEGVNFEGFNVYGKDQLTPATRRYIRFMRNVCVLGRTTRTLYEIVPTPSAES